MTVNVSSPNTPGLRDLQAVEQQRPLLTAVREALDEASPARRVPLLVKIAPDLADADVDAIAVLAAELGLDGIIAVNTTISRPELATPASQVMACGMGGLSGPPLKTRAGEVLRRLHDRTGGQLTLISVGGIETADDIWDRLRGGTTPSGALDHEGCTNCATQIDRALLASACDEDRYRILSQRIRRGRSPVVGGRLVVR